MKVCEHNIVEACEWRGSIVFECACVRVECQRLPAGVQGGGQGGDGEGGEEKKKFGIESFYPYMGFRSNRHRAGIQWVCDVLAELFQITHY